MDNNPTSGDQGGSTGTRDVTYDLTAVLYHALQGVENCQIYMGDAGGKQEHRQFFEGAMQVQKQLAEQAKQLLHDCLMQETGGGRAGSAATGAIGQQGMSDGTDAMGGEIASTQTHSFEQARDDGSAFRFASGQTEGGADQFGGGSEQDRQDSGRDQPTTGGGATSSF
ncbi:hypothetical protein [Sphingomonas glaciei]|uniref:Uncharacterized protein n=1 Tax=Sphingomonas glaciei TaxID=2938948 RepID=A0ABY5MUH5_9SPHN|nr:hypothetical protein [Sphingomonas glaciei]UUR07868.1 hypothetical protein M1K48_13190 [Sphingomonas glaciei]